MLYTINLGNELFSSPNQTLTLTLHASAILSFPPGTWSPESTESLTSALDSGELWVDQAPELKLNIDTSSEPDLACPHSTFVSCIGDVLCNSKLWIELGLVVLFESCEHSPQNHPGVSRLSFRIRRSARRITAKTSRLPVALRDTPDAISSDIAPTAYLSTINISLKYGCPGTPTLPSFTRSTKTSEDSLYYNPSPAELNHNEQYNPIEFPDSGAVDLYQKCGVSVFMEELLQIDEQELQHLRPPPPERDHLQADNCVISAQDLITLFSLGFRKLTSGKSNSGKQEHKSEGEFRSLSQVAPSVFSPGHRETLNQRAQFIPSIAKSMASIQKLSYNTHLQSKFAELEASVSNSFFQSTKSPRSTIKASLWRIAQKQLRNPHASRKLSPLIPESITYDNRTFEDESLFTEAHTEETDHTDGGYTTEEDSSKYLGTDEEDIDCDENGDVNSILSLSEDLEYPGNASLDDLEMLASDQVGNPPSPVLLSEFSALLGCSHDENWDDMLCEML